MISAPRPRAARGKRTASKPPVVKDPLDDLLKSPTRQPSKEELKQLFPF